jgi:lipopolysaccharide transport system permease protein
MYLTPVLFSAQSVLHHQPRWIKLIYFLNPMAGAVEGLRWSVLGIAPEDPALLGYSAVSAVVLLIVSMYYFKRIERQFADVV